MTNWITKQELETAKTMASEIFQDFNRVYCYQEGEQTWTEIDINGKFFDVECFDDDMDKPRTDTYCSIYPVYPTECGTWRETDGSKWIRLFTNKEVK
jgi:hypothetical protein